MPRVDLGNPPTIRPKRHSDYKPWLLRHFFDHLCSYCLVRDDGVHVEHHEPVTWAKHREKDPTNLLLGCDRCNGAGGKGDYHPAHTSRRRLPRDTSGHHVIDVRCDDFALMFEIDAEGRISARPGEARDRAQWNIVLLKLDAAVVTSRRQQLLRVRESCETALELKRAGDSRGTDLLERLVPWMAGQMLLLEVYGLDLSNDLRAVLDKARDAGIARS